MAVMRIDGDIHPAVGGTGPYVAETFPVLVEDSCVIVEV